MDLVYAGLSVAVCEEVKDVYSYGSMRRGPKERYVAAVITPANPHFLHGQVCQSVLGSKRINF